jgi:hypothetical protein
LQSTEYCLCRRRADVVDRQALKRRAPTPRSSISPYGSRQRPQRAHGGVLPSAPSYAPASQPAN